MGIQDGGGEDQECLVRGGPKEEEERGRGLAVVASKSDNERKVKSSILGEETDGDSR